MLQLRANVSLPINGGTGVGMELVVQIIFMLDWKMLVMAIVNYQTYRGRTECNI